MKKRVFAMAIPVLLILTLTAQAADLRLVRINPELYFDGSTAICSVFCRADIMCMLKLQQLPAITPLHTVIN